jgi:Trk-type K+ transport system membrane component
MMDLVYYAFAQVFGFADVLLPPFQLWGLRLLYGALSILILIGGIGFLEVMLGRELLGKKKRNIPGGITHAGISYLVDFFANFRQNFFPYFVMFGLAVSFGWAFGIFLTIVALPYAWMRMKEYSRRPQVASPLTQREMPQPRPD